MKLRELLELIKSVQEKIGSSTVYLCGGVARDRYTGKLSNINDLDVTSGDSTIDYTSKELFDLLSKKYNVVRKVMEDGHSSIYIGSLKLDFSSNFNTPNIIEILRKKNIINPTEMEKEIYSRDFTCNALLLSLDLKDLTDPTKRGFSDIKDKVIRTCLSPEITLTANKNRVARSIYLASKLDFDIDNSIVEFVKKNPQSIKISSPKSLSEKINDAFDKDADKASFYITKMGLWGEIPITEVIKPYYMKNVISPTKIAYLINVLNKIQGKT